MGGYEGGEIASKLATKAFIDYFKNNFHLLSISVLLIEATHHANKQLYKKKEISPSLEEMGCTLIATFTQKQTLFWVSVGDSILYKYNQDELIRLNADHSVAGDYQKEVQAGRLTQEEADAKPNRHALTSALTGYEIPHIEQSQIQISHNDKLIIASDGIHTIDKKSIISLCSKDISSQLLAENIIDAVKQKRLENQDNTTVIVLQDTIENTKKATSKSKILLSIILILLSIIVALVYLNYKDKILEYSKIYDNNETNVTTKIQSVKVIDKNSSTKQEEENATK
jgi:serine/threonine protein phosphatase PrpC